MAEKAILVLDGKEFELPIVVSTQGEKAIDISKLRQNTGYTTLDEGYLSTASCRSRVSYINGEKGILELRGIAIEELAEHSTFVEAAFLVIHGHLPSKGELENFSTMLNQSSLIHENLKIFLDAFHHNAHPMAILSMMVASLSQFYPTPDVLDPATESQFIANLISQVRTIAAFSYKKSIGEPFVYPSVDLKYVPNFLNMMFSSPVRHYELDPDIVKALDLFLILHLDHGQNCSTSTVRIVGSSRSNIYSAVSSGISALWGPLHGGANQAVIRELERIVASGMSIKNYIEKVKKKELRLMGFGHRVYKNFDPRARILKKSCHNLINKPGMMDPLFDIAMEIEDVALQDDYFLSRGLYPNVDFYSGLILRAIGIPFNMFTVLFAIGRMPGWLAQWREMYDDPEARITRPRQLYVGPVNQHYIPIDKRGVKA